jgi:hypothetical protein
MYMAPSHCLEITETNARKLLDDKCSDPLVRFIYFRSLERQKKDKDALELADAVYCELKERKYSSEILLRATYCLGWLYERTGQRQKRESLLNDRYKYLAMMTAEPCYTNGRQRYIVETYIDSNFTKDNGWAPFLKELENVKAPDPWIKLYVEGWFAIEKRGREGVQTGHVTSLMTGGNRLGSF